MGLVLLWLAVIAGAFVIQRLRRQVEATHRELRVARLEIAELRQRLERPAATPRPAGVPAVPPEVAAPEIAAPAALPPVEAEPPADEPPPLPAERPAAREPEPPPAHPAEPRVPQPLAAPPRRPPIGIDWERWIGVRGAAVLGGVVLALAAILFLKYTIERGLIPPSVRVALGFLAGGGSIAGSELLRRRRYGATADAVAGAGVVILYASVWAARALYDLVPAPLAWGLMVLITVVCGLLSWRRASLVIALLGLIGGFLTPLLLETRAPGPIGLFGYVLLLDVGLIWLATRRRWPLLTGLSLAGTFLYQADWVFVDMPPERLPLTLGILGLFVLLFTFTGSRERAAGSEALLWLPRAAGILLPFVFALHFAGRADLGAHLAPVAGLALLLSVAAVWTGRTQGLAWIPLAAAAADFGVVAVWVARTQLSAALAWELAAIGVALALAFHWRLELDHRRGRTGADWQPAVLATGAMAVLVVFARLHPEATAVFWPWLAGWLALAALWLRQAAIVPLPRLRLAVAALPAIAFTAFAAARGVDPAMPAPALYLGLMVAAAAAFQILGPRRGSAGSALDHPDAAAAVAALTLALACILIVDLPGFTAGYFFGATIALGLLAILAATRLGTGAVFLGAAALLAFGHTVWTLGQAASGFGLGQLDESRSAALVALLGGAASVALVTFWPFVAGRRLAAAPLTTYTAALAAPAWFLTLHWAYEELFGDGWIALLPLALGATSLAAALRGRRFWSPTDPGHRRSLVWFLAVALGFVTLAIPLQLDKSWITIAWALQGLAVMALWKRLDHPGLRYFGLALFAAVTLRLVANPALLGYYPRSGVPVLNWLMYTYLVPAAALLWSARLQEPLEVERRTRWENSVYAGPHPLGAAACAVATILVVFVWINLTIFDAFSRGPALSLSLARLPARDLTLSLAWILFALTLLAIGMARRSVSLRWISLAFLVLAIGKVFLYDLGELRELYRVASLVGLALSLLVVSLAYQRFVFGDERRGQAETKQEPRGE